ncbi:MAG: hypothetical protein P8182_13270, partial [Deltaproteobacteria bacterium]
TDLLVGKKQGHRMVRLFVNERSSSQISVALAAIGEHELVTPCKKWSSMAALLKKIESGPLAASFTPKLNLCIVAEHDQRKILEFLLLPIASQSRG